MLPLVVKNENSVSFEDWLINFLLENHGIQISFKYYSFKATDPDQILIKMHHVTQYDMKRIVPLDTQMNVDMKTVLIEEIESMANTIKEDVRKFNCGVD
jgi:hypothetical protein